jgi:hypothetical protein
MYLGLSVKELYLELRESESHKRYLELTLYQF